MITVKNKIFTITTVGTTYIMRVRDDRYIENLYYGRRLSGDMTDDATICALTEKFNNPYGNSITTPDSEDKVTLDNLCMEFSNAGTGDYRQLPLEMTDATGNISTRFYFKDSLLYEGLYAKREDTGMPYARYYAEDRKPRTLELILEDRRGYEMRLIYTAFDECDVITRRMVLTNNSDTSVSVNKLSSLQLDLPTTDYSMLSFDGRWTSERHMHEKELISGTYSVGSVNGTSSSSHNPFIMLKNSEATEHCGSVYAFNLIYSGNHEESVEVSEYGKVRVLTGINPYGLKISLNPGESFYTPEAMMTYSHEGLGGASAHCHDFVNGHIVPEQFAGRVRPILINNWEATYFDFNKRKLLGLAKDASALGMELFVLDDGWFGHRDDDTSSLGDWYVNERKIGGSLSSLIDKIHSYGMKFGIWIEPEMISHNSDLYRAHPDWAVDVPDMEDYVGRNQYILDYTNPDVCDYIVDTIGRLLADNDIAYVKWDMNRPITDAYSKRHECQSGTFYHEYVLGLYDVMRRLTEAFPDVLFEGCSAGGNRFDLGILSYMPQIWTSDDTDVHERVTIQGGTSYGYPQSTMGAHVSASPNHQTLRSSSIDSRFNVAALGVLGYELDLTRLTPVEKKAIASQVAFYKENRDYLQFGRFIRVKKYRQLTYYQIVSEDKSRAVVMMYRDRSEPNISYDTLYASGLEPDATYRVEARRQKTSIKEFGNLINQISPIAIKEEGITQAIVNSVYALDADEESYVVTGATLMYAGIKLQQRFVGTGLEKGTRVMGDNSAALYVITKEVR